MNKIFINIKKHIVIYILLAVVGVSTAIYTLNLSNMPRNEESIALFVGSKGTNNKLYNVLFEAKPSYIRRIQYRNFDTRDRKFRNNYNNYSYTLSDMIILPESKIIEADVPIVFALFNEEVVQEFSSITDFYVTNNNKYGFKIHEKGSLNNDYIDYGENDEDEDYYVFLKRESIHNGSLSNSSYRTSLDFVRLMCL